MKKWQQYHQWPLFNRVLSCFHKTLQSFSDNQKSEVYAAVIK